MLSATFLSSNFKILQIFSMISYQDFEEAIGRPWSVVHSAAQRFLLMYGKDHYPVQIQNHHLDNTNLLFARDCPEVFDST